MSSLNLSIATFNLYNFLEEGFAPYHKHLLVSKKHWQLKQAWVSKQIDQLDVDIVVVQEVMSVEPMIAMMADLGFIHYAVVDQVKYHAAYSRVVVQSVDMIFSKLPLLNIKATPVLDKTLHRFNLSEDAYFKRSPVEVQVSIGDVDFSIISHHLKSLTPIYIPSAPKWLQVMLSSYRNYFPKLTDGQLACHLWRNIEAIALYDYIKSMNQDNYGIMLLGDLNMDQQMPIYQTLTCGLLEEALSESSQPKFNTTNQQALINAADLTELQDLGKGYSCTFNGEGAWIDHILVSSKLSHRLMVKSYKIFNKQISKSKKTKAHKSDHAPVKIVLSPK